MAGTPAGLPHRLPHQLAIVVALEVLAFRRGGLAPQDLRGRLAIIAPGPRRSWGGCGHASLPFMLGEALLSSRLITFRDPETPEDPGLRLDDRPKQRLGRVADAEGVLRRRDERDPTADPGFDQLRRDRVIQQLEQPLRVGQVLAAEMSEAPATAE